jgi:hypothetical protein
MLGGVRLDSLPDFARGQFQSHEDLRQICHDNRLLMGHYSATTLVEAGCTHLATLARDPRARLLSLYRYWRCLPLEALTKWGPEGDRGLRAAKLPFDKFLVAPDARASIDNAMARQLLLRRPSGQLAHTRPMVARALRGSRYKWLLRHLQIAEWSSESQRLIDRVCEVVGMSTVGLQRVNESPVSDGVQEIGPKVLARLERLTELDRALLDRLSADGLLKARSSSDLDLEFHDAAERLDFAFS